MINYPDPQYITTIKKGDTVTYGTGSYRVQDDRGYLHIIVKESGTRKKIPLKELLFDYGSYQDYVFNMWWQVYESFEIFQSYAAAEIAWMDNKN